MVDAEGGHGYNTSRWNYIVAVSAGESFIAGLRSNGTVAISGFTDRYGLSSVDSWRDIVAIEIGRNHIPSYDDHDDEWLKNHIVGLRSDGTVVAAGYNRDGQCDVDDWNDIAAIFAGYHRTVGLRSDGTVVAVGDNSKGQCAVGDWTDIVAIAIGREHTVGLRSDGTAVAVGRNEAGQCNVGGWTDIVMVSAGWGHTVGLRADGTVVTTAGNDFKGWTDVVAITTSNLFGTIGIRSDGTILNDRTRFFSDWKLFDSIDALQKLAQAAEKRQAELKEKSRVHKSALENEKPVLQAELNRLGLFSGKRRREIEARLAEIETELKNL